MSDKSILDGIPVDDKQLKEVLDKQREQQQELPKWIQVKEKLGIVGSCPTCGAPIYGHQVVDADCYPRAKYSCQCVQSRAIGQTRTT